MTGTQKKATHTDAPAQPPPASVPETTAPPAAPAQPPAPTDPLGRISPHGTVLGFLKAAEVKDYQKAAQYLDGKRTPEQAETLIVQLKYLLDQGFSTSLDAISRSPSGDTEDKLRLSRETVGTITTPNGELPILLDLVKHSDGPAIWLFSQATLRDVPATYEGMHHVDYASWFPAWASRIHILSAPLWRWLFVLVSLVVLFALTSLLTRAVLWALRRIIQSKLATNVERAVLALKLPIYCLILAMLERSLGGYAITALGRHRWKTAGLILTWISLAWLIIRVSDILTHFYRHRLLLQGRVERATFVNLIGRLLQILVGLTLIIALLSHAGVNVSALVTGLGIGGVALALAAQKTLADLFGGLSIIMRGAVRVGDYCQIAGIGGTVEDIGISSLSLRTLDRSVVSIPNSKVAEANLENFSLRDQFWIHQIFTLRFDTPHEVVKIVIDKIYEILKSQPDVDTQSARIRLINMTASGPQLEIFAYYRKSGADMAAFLGQQENLLLKIMGTIEASGTSLAAPVGVLRMDSEKKSEDPSKSSETLIPRIPAK
ncbi:MAG TPA: mechanosensitive ion channel family protein [Edaphobacter sp.]|nr:mechanosensitive ion channel family protein [Edaphobacter sp.]